METTQQGIDQGRKADRQTFAFIGSGEGLIPSVDRLTKLEVGKAYYQLAKVYYDKADLDMAEVNFIKSLECADLPKDNFSVLKILGFLIRIAAEKLENEKASKYISMSESIVEDLASNLGSLNGEYFYYAGLVKSYKGDFDGASLDLNMAHKTSREENDPDLLAKCLLALANNSLNTLDCHQALDYLNQLDNLLKIINKEYLGGSMHMSYGKVYLTLGDHQKSLEHFKIANETLQNKKCWNLYGYVLLGKGQVYKLAGDFDRSVVYYNMASEAIDLNRFRRLSNLVKSEIQEVNDSSVDIYLDRTNRKVKEKTLGVIDFKHRFVLLEILFLLAKNTGEYFDKEVLAKMIWKDEYNPLIHDKLIYTSVSRLRKLIEPKNVTESKRKYIIRGKDGYTFNPNVKIRFQMEARLSPGRAIANVDISSPV